MNDGERLVRLRWHDGVASLFGRLPGHYLVAHGEAYLAVDCYTGRCATNLHATVHQANNDPSLRGKGHGLCSCGALSPHAPSYRKRRKWHRAHKARVLLGQPEPAPPAQPAKINPAEVA